MVTYRDTRTGQEHQRAEPSSVLDNSPRFERVPESRRGKTAATDDTNDKGRETATTKEES